MPIIVEPVFSEQIQVVVHLIIVFAINALEAIQTNFVFESFELEGIGFEIYFATPYYVSVVVMGRFGHKQFLFSFSFIF